MKRSSRVHRKGADPANCRRGYTLIEVTLYISMVAALGGSYVTVLRGAYRAQQDAVAMRNEGAQLHRFRRDWTHDIHASQTATVVLIEANPLKLVLQYDEEILVEYFLDGDRIRRHQWNGESLIAQEAYILTEEIELAWEVKDASRTVEASLWRDATDTEKRRLWRHIVARLASDARFARGAP